MNSTQQVIQELRKSGYSQTRIEAETGIPQPRISRWESGDVPKSADDALRLAKLLVEVQQAEPVVQDDSQG